jgi:hypothetical protein
VRKNEEERGGGRIKKDLTDVQDYKRITPGTPGYNYFHLCPSRFRQFIWTLSPELTCDRAALYISQAVEILRDIYKRPGMGGGREEGGCGRREEGGERGCPT